MLSGSPYAFPPIWETKTGVVIKPVEFKLSSLEKYAVAKTFNQKSWALDLKDYRNLRYEILKGLKHDWS